VVWTVPVQDEDEDCGSHAASKAHIKTITIIGS